jgi:hypothetical protein
MRLLEKLVPADRDAAWEDSDNKNEGCRRERGST